MNEKDRYKNRIKLLLHTSLNGGELKIHEFTDNQCKAIAKCFEIVSKEVVTQGDFYEVDKILYDYELLAM